MNGYFIRSSKVTPSIYFNPKTGLLDIRGKSSPENPLSFYHYIYESLDQFYQENYANLTANVAFEYFNTSSSKCIYMFLKKLSVINDVGCNITVNWYYEDGDHDMKEAGEDLSSFFDLKFNFVSIPEIVIPHQVRRTKQESAA